MFKGPAAHTSFFFPASFTRLQAHGERILTLLTFARVQQRILSLSLSLALWPSLSLSLSFLGELSRAHSSEVSSPVQQCVLTSTITYYQPSYT